MKRVLVTGGAGFIGSHIVDALVANYTVGILDNLSTGKKEWLNPKATFFAGSITDEAFVKKVMADFAPAVLNHHAAHKDLRVSVEDPIHDAMINIMGLLNLLQTPQAAKLTHVVFPSTAAVYGETRQIPTPETAPTDPLAPYGISKLAGEKYLIAFGKQHRIPTAILRYANVYGPRQDPFGEGGVVAIFTQKVLAKKNPTIFGDGLQTRDFVYVGDVAAANLAAIAKKLDGLYNLSTATETSVNHIFEALRHRTAAPVTVRYEVAKPSEARRVALSNTALKHALGWEPSTQFKQGLQKTLDWFQTSTRKNDKA